MAATSIARRSDQSVDAGVPISDVIRDPRVEKLSDDRLAYEIIERWQACVDSQSDLRYRVWPRNLFDTFSDYDYQWSPRVGRWLNAPVKGLRKYRTPLLPGRLAYFAARMTQSAPEWTAIPSGDGISEEETAKFCEKLLRYAYREQRVDLARYFAVIQMCLFGFGLLETCVDEEATIEPIYEHETDPETGFPVIDPETQAPVFRTDKDGRPRIVDAETRPGIRVRPVSPFAFGVAPGVEWPLLRDAPYVVKASMLSESYVRRRFDVPRSETLVNDADGMGYESMHSYLWSTNPFAAPTDRYSSGRILVLQYYEPARDVKGFYEGMIYTVVGQKLIAKERSLFDDGRYPFFMFPWMPIPGQFAAFPWMNPQIDPQRRMNQTLTHLMDHMGRVGSPVLLAEKNSGVPAKPTFQYGVWNMAQGRRWPEFLQAREMPSGAFEMHAKAQADIDQAGMSYGLARGESQSGVTSGLHARLIQDADQTEMGPIVRMHAAEFSAMGEAELDLHRSVGGDDRMLAIVGAGGDSELFEFKKGKIPIGQRVFVQEESLLVHYRSALEERAGGIAAAGGFGNMLTDPMAQQKFMRAIRDPKVAGPLTPEECQRQFLDEIHHRILHKGERIKVEMWWDLNAHRSAAHERLCRESLRWDPQTKARFIDYWDSIEEAQKKVDAANKQAAIEDAKTQIGLAGEAAQVEQQAKLPGIALQGMNKLAIESMKDPKNMGAGAGAGAAALSAGQDDEDGGENAAPGKE